jgi:hypothetical protein
MLVRIQLGQQANPLDEIERVFVLPMSLELARRRDGETKNQFFAKQKRVCLSINSFRINEVNPAKNGFIIKPLQQGWATSFFSDEPIRLVLPASPEPARS